MLSNNAGIYNVNSSSLKRYCNLYFESIKNSNHLACFTDGNRQDVISAQNYMKPNDEVFYFQEFWNLFIAVWKV